MPTPRSQSKSTSSRPKSRRKRQDWDSPWKEIIERFFQAFILFFFPRLYRLIDWSQPYTFRDKEFQKIVRDAQSGKLYVDKLVEVCLKGGDSVWIWIHIEIQGYVETKFTARMYHYHIRLASKAGHPVVSVAVLSDEDPNWRPQEFVQNLAGCSVKFRFPIVKLLDYGKKWDQLERSKNPFAMVVMAHLKAMETQKDMASRYNWKWHLTRILYQKGYSEQDVIDLYWFLDWVMALPEAEERRFTEEISTWEGKQKMRYVTWAERFGRERGQQELLLNLLRIKFQEVPEEVIKQVKTLSPQRIEQLAERILTAQSLAEMGLSNGNPTNGHAP